MLQRLMRSRISGQTAAWMRLYSGITSGLRPMTRPILCIRCFLSGAVLSILAMNNTSEWPGRTVMTMARPQDNQASRPAPFDQAKLDALLDKAGIDVLVLTSKHNIQYLLGGYRFFFFDFMDAIGVSRYLPVMVYRKGRPDQAAYFGNGLETYERQLDKFWPATV